jgi:fructose-1,6-bisphosphatase/sedoheptulose 1,7-bisphosphatase-like protein
MLDGVRQEGGFVHTHSIVMASWSCTIREVRMKKKIPAPGSGATPHV